MKWLVDGTEIEADSYTEGTDYVQFWADGKEVAAVKRGTSIQEVTDGSETELLAEVRPEGETDEPTPERSSDADAPPRQLAGKLPQRPGKVSRL